MITEVPEERRSFGVTGPSETTTWSVILRRNDVGNEFLMVLLKEKGERGSDKRLRNNRILFEMTLLIEGERQQKW